MPHEQKRDDVGSDTGGETADQDRTEENDVTPEEEDRGVTVEEESEQSFPASDPPSY